MSCRHNTHAELTPVHCHTQKEHITMGKGSGSNAFVLRLPKTTVNDNKHRLSEMDPRDALHHARRAIHRWTLSVINKPLTVADTVNDGPVYHAKRPLVSNEGKHVATTDMLWRNFQS